MIRSVIVELPKENDKLLFAGVYGLTLIHGMKFPGYNFPVVFGTESFRIPLEQYPWKIELETVYLEDFNQDNFNYSDLRKKMEISLNETLLIYRDDKGKLINNLYLGRQHEADPYTRLVYTTNPKFKSYYKNEDIGISFPGKKFLNAFT